MSRLLIVEPDTQIRKTLEQSLPLGTQTMVKACGRSDLSAIRLHNPAIIIIGPSLAEPLRLPLDVTIIRDYAPHTPLLLVTFEGSEELAIAALRSGVAEYLRYPWRTEEVTAAIDRCMRANRSVPAGIAPSLSDRPETVPIIGESAVMQGIREHLARAGASDSTILITGETGTGKELAAEFVNGASPRRNRPLVTINCAAIPDALLESELFGYEQGAFTGAQSSKDGKLKAAQGGTVFLDEIGEMSLLAQAKILRAMEGKEIQRLGRNAPMPVDVRIIAATNCEIEKLITEGKFRKDLYYRLNVARIHLPPLRERKEDIPPIVRHYVQIFNRRFGRNVSRITDDAWDCLLSYTWPGNIRELKNLVEASFLYSSGSELSADHLPSCLHFGQEKKGHDARDEQKQLLSALLSTNWNKSKAAEKLQWSRMTLYRKIAKYGMSRVRASAIVA
jgi:DNA-binding NtrC family response regulator